MSRGTNEQATSADRVAVALALGNTQLAITVSAAAELRRLADDLDVVKAEMRAVDNRTIRSSGLSEGIARMRARADELDPQRPDGEG